MASLLDVKALIDSVPNSTTQKALYELLIEDMPTLTQTLTNKSLTDPTIAAATISGAFTSTATITGGTLASATITGATITTSTFSGTAVVLTTGAGTGIDFTGTFAKGIDFSGVSGGAASASGLLMGAGTSGSPSTSAAADAKFIEFRCQNSATSGDNRLMYLRFDQSGAGGGGECIRAFTKVSAALGTARGAHISLDMADAGSITGLGVGVDAQLIVANAALTGGTYAALNVELYPAGTTTDPAGVTAMAWIRCNLGSTGAGRDNIEDDAYFLLFEGIEAGAGEVFDSTVNTAGPQIDHTLKCKIGGSVVYIPLMDNADGS